MTKPIRSLLLGSALLAFSSVALPQSTDRLVQQYTPLAGSESNAQSLVEGLGAGTQVKLASPGSAADFTPPTGKMGNGGVNIALSLAQASLEEQGIAEPTPLELQTALMGGTLDGKTIEGVLQMRADGKGWGQISQTLGFKLGHVMRSERASVAGKPERVARAERPARMEKPERPVRPERPVKPERPAHPGR